MWPIQQVKVTCLNNDVYHNRFHQHRSTIHNSNAIRDTLLLSMVTLQEKRNAFASKNPRAERGLLVRHLCYLSFRGVHICYVLSSINLSIVWPMADIFGFYR